MASEQYADDEYETTVYTPTRMVLKPPDVYDSPLIKKTDHGPKFVQHVNLIMKDFEVQDVKIKVGRSRISVKAKHVGVFHGRKSTKEYSRSFNVPEEVEFSTVRAVLGPDSKMVICGSLKTNENHDEVVADFMNNDMPEDGDMIECVQL